MNFLQTKINEMKKRKEEGNKGFSLVELIIVIAIMAILVGIVGTQVLPYINKSRAEKDRQLVSSYATAAVTAYTENAENIDTTATYTFTVYGTHTADTAEETLAKAIQKKTYDAFPSKFKSKDAKGGVDILIKIDAGNHEVTAKLVKGHEATSDATSLSEVKADL